MDWITETIAIGNSLDARDRAKIEAGGIRSILCLDGKLLGKKPDDLGVDEVEVFDLIDGEGNSREVFERAVRAANGLVQRRPKLLVHCHAGRSRSVVVVAAHLMMTGKLTMQQALDHISARREICVSGGLDRMLRSAWLTGASRRDG